MWNDRVLPTLRNEPQDIKIGGSRVWVGGGNDRLLDTLDTDTKARKHLRHEQTIGTYPTN